MLKLLAFVTGVCFAVVAVSVIVRIVIEDIQAWWYDKRYRKWWREKGKKEWEAREGQK